jgi:predicted DNA-binding transcriptional regulator
MVTDEDTTPIDTPVKVKYKVSLFLCLHNDIRIFYYLMLALSMRLGNILRMLEILERLFTWPL